MPSRPRARVRVCARVADKETNRTFLLPGSSNMALHACMHAWLCTTPARQVGQVGRQGSAPQGRNTPVGTVHACMHVQPAVQLASCMYSKIHVQQHKFGVPLTPGRTGRPAAQPPQPPARAHAHRRTHARMGSRGGGSGGINPSTAARMCRLLQLAKPTSRPPPQKKGKPPPHTRCSVAGCCHRGGQRCHPTPPACAGEPANDYHSRGASRATPPWNAARRRCRARPRHRRRRSSAVGTQSWPAGRP